MASCPFHSGPHCSVVTAFEARCKCRESETVPCLIFIIWSYYTSTIVPNQPYFAISTAANQKSQNPLWFQMGFAKSILPLNNFFQNLLTLQKKCKNHWNLCAYEKRKYLATWVCRAYYAFFFQMYFLSFAGFSFLPICWGIFNHIVNPDFAFALIK